MTLLCTGHGIAQGGALLDAPAPVQIDFSVAGGFYEETVRLSLSSPGASVYFTINGNTPGADSYRYRRPITIKETTTIRAVAVHQDGRRSNIISHTYFIGEPESDLPVVAVSLPPSALFHPYRGLFVLGSNLVDTTWKKPGANFWSKREVPASVELFETDGECVHRSLSGFRLFGGMSRLFPQKSIALVARQRYGQKRIKHKVFGKGQPSKYKYLVLRNSGSDFGKAHFRDALMTSLVEDWDIDRQAYRPAHVYLNGRYWGIYNIREKVNRFFIASHHKGVDKDSIDLVEHRHTLKRGSIRHYQRLLDFIEENSLSPPANYAYIKTLMDVDNFIDFQIAQIYFDNRDAGGNIKFWRPQTPDGRWRWILYDTDWGFGLHDTKAYEFNSLAFHTEAHGPSWPNPPWSTLLLRKLLENDDFRHRFVNRFADHLNDSFREDQVVQRIDSFYHQLGPEIDRHLKRWKLSGRKWETEVSTMRQFAQQRPTYVRMHLMSQLSTGAQRRLVLSTNPGGRILVNDGLSVSGDTLEAIYFERYPIQVRAIAHQGYRFSHWEGIEVDPGVRELTFALTERVTRLRAVFERFDHPYEGKLVINEVCPKNKQTGDWVELFNNSDKRISLKYWTLGDLKRNEFTFPEVYIRPGDFLVVCRDSAKFVQAHPEAYNVIGGLGFGLNKEEERLGLYSILGAMVDSIHYTVAPTDSSFALNLPLPGLDNSRPGNWAFQLGSGSPNAPNPYYVESEVRHVQAQWMQMGLAIGVLIMGVFVLIFRRREVSL